MPGKAQHLRTYPTIWVVVAKIGLVVVVKIVVEVVVKVVVVFEMMVISFARMW